VFHFHTHILSGSKNINLIDKNLWKRNIW
jgi:hypothetical protein